MSGSLYNYKKEFKVFPESHWVGVFWVPVTETHLSQLTFVKETVF